MGNFCLVLHTHLPYVLHHGTWPHGTDWLYEAAAGTYIPLLKTFDELLNEGFHPKATIGITPVLAEQLADPLFQKGFLHHLNNRILTARQDERYFRKINDSKRQETAQFWIEHFSSIKYYFNICYDRNLLLQFRRLQEIGRAHV